MDQIIEKLSEYGIVPVVVINQEEDAVPLAKALCEGGLKCAEVTFRTAAAKGAIKAMSEAYPDMLIGAGTVLSIEQVENALEAGAKFIVSPGFDAEIVDYCIEKKIPFIPGCMTPSEVTQGVKRGLDVLKFFPANNAGGVPMLKAISAPFPHVKFMPTGGISAGNVAEYLEFSKVLCCGGSWMVKADLIQNKEFDKIKAMTQEACEIVKTVRGI